ncbi:MAG: BtpA/SgcQ family protein [Actinomycetes bacterium]
MSPFSLVGVIHLPPLPGAANFQNFDIRKLAREAARGAQTLVDCGFTHVMIQDGQDFPQPTLAHQGTIASMSAIGLQVREAISVPLGVIVGHNDGPGSVAIAKAIAADFVRVKTLTGIASGPNGFIEGCATQVALTKQLLKSDVEVWADAQEATSIPLVADKVLAARYAVDFGGANRVIVTSDAGPDVAADEIAQMRASLKGQTDYIIGGRVTLGNFATVIGQVDGVIIGSAISSKSNDGTLIDEDTARKFGEILQAS